MDLVIDANILFSTFIKQGKTIEILLNPLFNLYAPVYIFEEIEEHKDEILAKTNRSEKELNELISSLLDIVKLVPSKEIEQYMGEAEKLSPDKDDIIYFALALKLNCAIWSNDKKLKEQNRIKIYSTSDLENSS